MKKSTIIISIATILTFFGCGGGSSSSTDNQTVTGNFRDTYVSGLTYKCSSGKKDFTNANGEYTCNVGDTVEFLLGSYSLGTASASKGVVTPRTLYPGNIEAEVNVAQLLQSLDDKSDSEIITIPENFSGLNAVTVSPTDATFDATMTTTLASLETGAVTLVTEAHAIAHLQVTYTDVVKNLLKGKTLYSQIDNRANTFESLVFNADATSATWTELIGGSCSGSGTITIQGMDINFTSTADSCDASDVGKSEIITVTEILNDYIKISAVGQEGRLYFDEEKARAHFLTNTTATKNLLAGKTVYIVGQKSGELAKVNFSTDMHSLSGRQLVGGTDSWNDTISISGRVITIIPKNAADGIETITITEITSDYLVATYREDDDGDITTETLRIYFDETKARTYLGYSTSTNLTTLLAGKTLYSTIDDRIKTLENWSFNANATSSIWSEMVGGNCIGSGDITINGMNINFTSTTDSCSSEDIGKTETLTVTEIKNDYISISVGKSAPQRLFFTETKAREFYITNAVKNYFTGQTRYFANINGTTGVRTYNTNGTYTGKVGNKSVAGTYSINGDTLTLTNSSANRILVLTHKGYGYGGEKFSITQSSLTGINRNTTTTYLYRNKIDRDAGRAKYIQTHP